MTAILSRLRFNHLRLVVAIGREGSLRAASQTLHLTAPAVSKSLGELENLFGWAIFERTRRGLVPTRRGRVLVRGAEALLEEVGKLRAEAEALTDGEAAIVRIGAPPQLAFTILPEAIRHLRAAQPPARAEVIEDRLPGLVESLAAGRVDALVTKFLPGEPLRARMAGLRSEKLFDERFEVVACAGHPLAGERRVPWSRLAGHAWVLPAEGSLIRRLVDEAFLRAGIMPPEAAAHSSNPLTNLMMVSAGLGLGVVPGTALAGLAGACDVRRIDVASPIATVPISLVYRAVMERHPRITLLRNALQEVVAARETFAAAGAKVRRLTPRRAAGR